MKLKILLWWKQFQFNSRCLQSTEIPFFFITFQSDSPLHGRKQRLTGLNDALGSCPTYHWSTDNPVSSESSMNTCSSPLVVPVRSPRGCDPRANSQVPPRGQMDPSSIREGRTSNLVMPPVAPGIKTPAYTARCWFDLNKESLRLYDKFHSSILSETQWQIFGVASPWAYQIQLVLTKQMLLVRLGRLP